MEILGAIVGVGDVVRDPRVTQTQRWKRKQHPPRACSDHRFHVGTEGGHAGMHQREQHPEEQRHAVRIQIPRLVVFEVLNQSIGVTGGGVDPHDSHGGEDGGYRRDEGSPSVFPQRFPFFVLEVEHSRIRLVGGEIIVASIGRL